MQKYGYNDYPNEDRQRLRDLLQAWKMEFVHQLLVDQCITMTTLKLIQKDDINELMSDKFPIGTKVLFTYKLQEWQKRNPLSSSEYSDLNDDTFADNLSAVLRIFK
ncbi:uncharacterized protein LOC111035509 [Myzus persicae]|uniref:uncharacterized protein LOC111035509 n=1 Tax=Myzus persicae TaxID=13164 RepID=UPI000B9367FA|nr:uncharacterized protein LOC111035509 [Myzus persicae]